MIDEAELKRKQAFLLQKVATAFGVSVEDPRIRDLAWDLDITLIPLWKAFAAHQAELTTLQGLTKLIAEKVEALEEEVAAADGAAIDGDL